MGQALRDAIKIVRSSAKYPTKQGASIDNKQGPTLPSAEHSDRDKREISKSEGQGASMKDVSHFPMYCNHPGLVSGSEQLDLNIRRPSSTNSLALMLSSTIEPLDFSQSNPVGEVNIGELNSRRWSIGRNPFNMASNSGRTQNPYWSIKDNSFEEMRPSKKVRYTPPAENDCLFSLENEATGLVSPNIPPEETPSSNEDIVFADWQAELNRLSSTRNTTTAISSHRSCFSHHQDNVSHTDHQRMSILQQMVSSLQQNQQRNTNPQQQPDRLSFSDCCDCSSDQLPAFNHFASMWDLEPTPVTVPERKIKHARSA